MYVNAKRPEHKAKIKLGNIVIVLVEPQSPGDIGAAARAMRNMCQSGESITFPALPSWHIIAWSRYRKLCSGRR